MALHVGVAWRTILTEREVAFNNMQALNKLLVAMLIGECSESETERKREQVKSLYTNII